MRNEYPDNKEIAAVCRNAKQLDESHSSDPVALKDCISEIQDQFIRMNLYQKGFISVADAYVLSIAIRKLYVRSLATQNDAAQKAVEDLLMMRFGKDEKSLDYFNAPLFEVLLTTLCNEDLFEREPCRSLIETLRKKVKAENDGDTSFFAKRHHSFPIPTPPEEKPEQNKKQPYYRSASPVRQKPSHKKSINPATPLFFNYHFPDFPTPVSPFSSLEADQLDNTPSLYDEH